MNQAITNHFENSIHHIYISPLEQCNLCCKMCYTTKTSDRLTNEQILGFVQNYHQGISIQSITFCGGEVFLLPEFTTLVNQLTEMSIFVQIITNGTINRLSEIRQPNNCNLIVSIDGIPAYHNQNRGENRWQQAIDFLKDAQNRGFHTEVFSIVTKENIGYINEFEKLLQEKTRQPIPVTYHPRKPLSYLQAHPISNQMGETKGFSFISASERQELDQQKTVFPSSQLGCYQISVMSDGQVYGCCEGIHPLGKITTNPQELIKTFQARLDTWCNQHPTSQALGCTEPDFICGLPEITSEETCH